MPLPSNSIVRPLIERCGTNRVPFFLFDVFAITLLIVVPVMNFILPTRIGPFKGGYYTIATLPRFLHNALFCLVRYTVLPFVTLD